MNSTLKWPARVLASLHQVVTAQLQCYVERIFHNYNKISTPPLHLLDGKYSWKQPKTLQILCHINAKTEWSPKRISCRHIEPQPSHLTKVQ